jgi:hypothetical protein
MLKISIPGRKDLTIKNVVFDFNAHWRRTGKSIPRLRR